MAPAPASTIHVSVAAPCSAESLEARMCLAGVMFAMDQVLEALLPYQLPNRGRPSAPVIPVRRLPPPSTPTWRSTGSSSLGSWDLAYRASYDPHSGYTIDLAPGLRLLVAADGQCVALDHPCAFALDDPAISQSVLGPGLLLALALQGSFAFHASAAVLGERAVVFLGDSGAGKSTLAADLDQRWADGWQRLADDVLPVAPAADGGLDAWPEFPQLKLAAEAQYVADGSRPERVPVAAIYLLDAFNATTADSAPTAATAPAETAAADEVMITAVSPRDAVLTLVAHTMAGRLFAPDLAVRHFAFCAAAAAAVPLKHLRYPRRMEALDAVAEALARDLAV